MGLSDCFCYKANTEDKSIKGSGVKVWPLSHFVYERQGAREIMDGFHPRLPTRPMRCRDCNRGQHPAGKGGMPMKQLGRWRE